MKKSILFLPLIAIATLSTSACNNKSSSPRITYGTYIESAATQLKYVDLALKVARGENFLIAVYDDSGFPCGCWTAFKNVLDQYVDEFDTRVYYIGRSQFSPEDEKYGLTILGEGTNPTFAFIANGKKANEYIYGNDNKPMFETLDGLRSAVKRIARDPQYYYVNEDYLDNAIFVKKTPRVLIEYVWSFCPDCNDCFPNVLFPYSEKHDFKTNVWIIDLAVDGYLLENGEYIGPSNENYINFMSEHHVSNDSDEKFGYDRGFVPTMQIWEKGKLIDMTVYFNDEVSLVDGEYQISRSYYSKDRVKNLKYTNTVLEGITINEEQVDVGKDGSLSWNKEYARKYHQPILEDFLDRYL